MKSPAEIVQDFAFIIIQFSFFRLLRDFASHEFENPVFHAGHGVAPAPYNCRPNNQAETRPIPPTCRKHLPARSLRINDLASKRLPHSSNALACAKETSSRPHTMLFCGRLTPTAKLFCPGLSHCQPEDIPCLAPPASSEPPAAASASAPSRLRRGLRRRLRLMLRSREESQRPPSPPRSGRGIEGEVSHAETRAHLVPIRVPTVANKSCRLRTDVPAPSRFHAGRPHQKRGHQDGVGKIFTRSRKENRSLHGWRG